MWPGGRIGTWLLRVRRQGRIGASVSVLPCRQLPVVNLTQLFASESNSVKRMLIDRFSIASFLLLCAIPSPVIAASSDRLRLIIETDAGGDPDDEQSLVRFLLYANEWDVEGI